MYKKYNEEVYVSTADIVSLTTKDIDFLKEKLAISPRGRVRICAHRSNSETIHEMFIAISKRSYIRPHRHFNKIESFHLVEGEADIVIFSNDGKINQVIPLEKNKNIYYRLNMPYFHTLLLKSDVLIIHETTNGPFLPEDTEFADFSPSEDDADVEFYVTNLSKKVLLKNSISLV